MYIYKKAVPKLASKRATEQTETVLPPCRWRASSVNCLVPSSKFYMFKLSDNNEAQHWRSDGQKCYNNARTNMPKGYPVVTTIYFYLETEQGINKEFRKQFFFKMNSSLGSFLLHYNGDESVSVPWVLINEAIKTLRSIFHSKCH